MEFQLSCIESEKRMFETLGPASDVDYVEALLSGDDDDDDSEVPRC